jgi:hypothetical protein
MKIQKPLKLLALALIASGVAVSSFAINCQKQCSSNANKQACISQCKANKNAPAASTAAIVGASATPKNAAAATVAGASATPSTAQSTPPKQCTSVLQNGQTVPIACPAATPSTTTAAGGAISTTQGEHGCVYAGPNGHPKTDSTMDASGCRAAGGVFLSGGALTASQGVQLCNMFITPQLCTKEGLRAALCRQLVIACRQIFRGKTKIQVPAGML